MKKIASKILASVASVTICTFAVTAMAFAAPAYDNSISTSYRDKCTLEKTFRSGGYEYGVAAYYNVGNSNNIFSNPSIAVKAGAEPLKDRRVYAKLKERSSGEEVTQQDGGVNAIGTGLKYIEVNAWKFGQYGTGYGTAKVYDGKAYDTSNLVGSLKITVS